MFKITKVVSVPQQLKGELNDDHPTEAVIKQEEDLDEDPLSPVRPGNDPNNQVNDDEPHVNQNKVIASKTATKNDHHQNLTEKVKKGHHCSVCSRTFTTVAAFELHAHGNNNNSDGSSSSQDSEDDDDDDDDSSDVDSFSDLDSDIEQEIFRQFQLEKQKLISKKADAKAKGKRAKSPGSESDSDDNNFSSSDSSSSSDSVPVSKKRKKSNSKAKTTKPKSTRSTLPRRTKSTQKSVSKEPKKRGRPRKTPAPSETPDGAPRKKKLKRKKGGSFYCSKEECRGKKFHARVDFEQHVRHSHGVTQEERESQRAYPCTEAGCSSRFYNSSGLAAHKLVHLASKPGEFKCDWADCSKSFHRPYQLTKHIKISHEKLRPKAKPKMPGDTTRKKDGTIVKEQEKDYQPVQCDLCAKTLKNRKSLGNHMRTSHDPEISRRFPCTEAGCDKAFSSRPYLKDHVNRFHLKKKEVTCPDCPKLFSDRSALSKHRKFFHLKLRPHLCDNCGQGFITEAALQLHIRGQHDPDAHIDRTFLCPHCGKSFTTNAGCQRHVDAHLGLRKYKCPHPGCNAEYLQGPSLKTHMRNKHPGV